MAAASNSSSKDEDNLFSYSNTMELTFSKKPRMVTLEKSRVQIDDSSSSSDSDEDNGLSVRSTTRRDKVSNSVEENEVQRINDDNIERDTPSPPPPPKLNVNGGCKVSKQTAASLKALNMVKRLLSEDDMTSPSPSNKRSRLDDLIVIDGTPTQGREITVKIKCHGIVNKYKIKENEPFDCIISSIAREENTAIKKILLYLGEEIIDKEDTPLKVGYNVADILECVIVSDKHHGSHYLEDDGKDEEKIKIKIQTKDMHSKQEFCISKTSPLEEVVRKYCKERNLIYNDVHIYFDGEEANLTDTPEMLEMEDDDIIDLKHK